MIVKSVPTIKDENNEITYMILIDGMESEVIIRLKKTKFIELRNKLNDITIVD
mgnify:CR=1 FL=1